MLNQLGTAVAANPHYSIVPRARKDGKGWLGNQYKAFMAQNARDFYKGFGVILDPFVINHVKNSCNIKCIVREWQTTIEVRANEPGVRQIRLGQLKSERGKINPYYQIWIEIIGNDEIPA